MWDKNNSTIRQLEELCLEFIAFLDDMKDKGLISEEDYIKHTKLKKAFLESVKKVELV